MLPVHIASVQGHIKIITELIDNHDVDKCAENKVIIHQLHSFEYTYFFMFCLCFLKWHYYIQDGFCPIHFAARGNQKEVLELLIDKYQVQPSLASRIVSINFICTCIMVSLQHSNDSELYFLYRMAYPYFIYVQSMDFLLCLTGYAKDTK